MGPLHKLVHVPLDGILSYSVNCTAQLCLSDNVLHSEHSENSVLGCSGFWGFFWVLGFFGGWIFFLLLLLIPSSFLLVCFVLGFLVLLVGQLFCVIGSFSLVLVWDFFG